MNQKEFLLAKSEGAKDCAKHLIQVIKKEQEELQWLFERWGRGYGNETISSKKSRIEALVEQKISLEKYAKKLRHQAEESLTRGESSN